SPYLLREAGWAVPARRYPMLGQRSLQVFFHSLLSNSRSRYRCGRLHMNPQKEQTCGQGKENWWLLLQAIKRWRVGRLQERVKWVSYYRLPTHASNKITKHFMSELRLGAIGTGRSMPFIEIFEVFLQITSTILCSIGKILQLPARAFHFGPESGEDFGQRVTSLEPALLVVLNSYFFLLILLALHHPPIYLVEPRFCSLVMGAKLILRR